MEKALISHAKEALISHAKEALISYAKETYWFSELPFSPDPVSSIRDIGERFSLAPALKISAILSGIIGLFEVFSFRTRSAFFSTRKKRKKMDSE